MITYKVVVDDDGREWYLDNKRHRIDGPAIEWADGSRYWYLDGNLHRIDGPAIEYADGDRQWYVDGKELTETEFNTRTKSTCSGRVVEIDGVKYKLTAI